MFTYCQYGEATGIKGIECPPECWVLDLEDIEANTGKILKIVAAKDRKSTSGKYLFSKNMVLYSKLRPYLNKVVVATNDGCCTTEIIPISLFAKSSPHFLQLLLMSPMFVDTINADSYGVKMPRADTAQVKSFLLPIPPKNEQQRIVEQFDKLLPYIESYKESQASLEAINTLFAPNLKKSILQHAIQGKLVPQDPTDEPARVLLERIAKERAKVGKKAGKSMSRIERRDRGTFLISPDGSEADISDEIPFDIPETWSWCQLSDIAELQTGTTPSTSRTEYFGEGIPFIKPADILNGSINYHNESLTRLGAEKSRMVTKGALLMVCIGGSIGKCSLVDRDVCFNQQINAATPIIIESAYLHAYLSSSYIAKAIREKATGTATPIINKTLWGQLLIALPPYNEQLRICNKLHSIIPTLC